MPGELTLSGRQLAAGSGQIGAFIGRQRRGIARQAEADLQIRHGIHERIQHVLLYAALAGVRHLRAEHGIIDEQTRFVARRGVGIAGGDAGVDALGKRVLIDVHGPVGAGIAAGILAEDDQQHLCQLAQRHAVGRAEFSGAADDDLLLGAIGNVGRCPGIIHVIEHGSGILCGFRRSGGQKRHQLGDLFAADIVLRAEVAVRVAGDKPEVTEHTHGVVILNILLIGKFHGVRGQTAYGGQADQNCGKQAAKKLPHGAASFLLRN